MTLTDRAFGAQSMTADLRDVLVSPPEGAFARAYDHPSFGFQRPCDIGPAPAVINALRHAGFDLREIPATPERVMAAPRREGTKARRRDG